MTRGAAAARRSGGGVADQSAALRVGAARAAARSSKARLVR